MPFDYADARAIKPNSADNRFYNVDKLLFLNKNKITTSLKRVIRLARVTQSSGESSESLVETRYVFLTIAQ